MSNIEISVFDNSEKLSSEFCEYFAEIVNGRIARMGFAAVAISGGKTPDEIFKRLSAEYHNSINWPKLLVYWADERCVPPNDPESNYGRASELLINNVEIVQDNVFRIRGEDDPVPESERYAGLISTNLLLKNDLSVFDLVMLGVGEDGHTASIFQGDENLFRTDALTAVTSNPATGQSRITLTGSLINNASNVAVIVTGQSKRNILERIFDKENNELLPAKLLNTSSGNVRWFITEEALPGNLS